MTGNKYFHFVFFIIFLISSSALSFEVPEDYLVPARCMAFPSGGTNALTGCSGEHFEGKYPTQYNTHDGKVFLNIRLDIFGFPNKLDDQYGHPTEYLFREEKPYYTRNALTNKYEGKKTTVKNLDSPKEQIYRLAFFKEHKNLDYILIIDTKNLFKVSIFICNDAEPITEPESQTCKSPQTKQARSDEIFYELNTWYFGPFHNYMHLKCGENDRDCIYLSVINQGVYKFLKRPKPEAL